MVKCNICDTECIDENELEIKHRGCRLKNAFPSSYSENGSIIGFDMSKIKEAIGYKEPLKLKSGIEFFSTSANEVWVECRVYYSNVLSSLSWLIRNEEIDAVIEYMKSKKTNR